jgi:multisubunit Na+/H+ antiporter MnhF subunit
VILTLGDFGPLTLLINFIYALLGIALFLALARLVRGPQFA